MSEIKVNSVVNSTGDNDSGLDLSTNDQVIIKTANTTAVTVDSSQGTTMSGALSAKGGAVFNEDSADVDFRVESNGNANMLHVDGGNDRVGIGAVAGSGNGLAVTNTDGGSALVLHRDFSGSNVSSETTSATLDFTISDSASSNQSIAKISPMANAGTGDALAGILRFFTANDAGTITERARFTGSTFVIGKTQTGAEFEGITLGSSFGTFTRGSGVPVFVNRQNDDGTLIEFRQGNTTEGQIGVVGTTVSLSGGHLSRYSQLADNTRESTLVKGTVMTNLDQMAKWTKDGVTEDNEQLNCMAVSNVEGDANVAGVFVSWDNDDEVYKNDMIVAMTGDMVIRIAKGTKVARGDLLMSAGDGTAKPQDDDIVRSKTIAKVTSTNVSHTYDDGTYLVPCVLMAC